MLQIADDPGHNRAFPSPRLLVRLPAMSLRPVRAFVPILLLLGLAAPAAAQQVRFKLVINAANLATGLRKDQVATLFLNHNTKWGDGTPGAPVDQSTRSPIREVFS